MCTWRDIILKEFVPRVSKLTLVADPDGLLGEEKLAMDLRRRGFDLIEFADPIEFRYAYESMYRGIWDRGEHTDLVVILRASSADLESLPYDLLQAGRKLYFNLGDIFPKLSYPVIENLDRNLLDALYEAQCRDDPENMGKNATIDFILRNVFHISVDLIHSDVDLLRCLLAIHYGKRALPKMLNERLQQALVMRGSFHDWPLADIIGNDMAFYEFLQERWPVFLESGAVPGQLREDYNYYGLRYPGPVNLPFGHEDIKIYIDNLFLEGKLKPVDAAGMELEANSWMRCGVKEDGEAGNERRISRLFELVDHKWPNANASCRDWITYAINWSRLSSMLYGERLNVHQEKLSGMNKEMNGTFAAWLIGHYHSLRSMSPASPALLHHLPRMLARKIEESDKNRVALVVVDGLAFEQWMPISAHLQKQDASLILREDGVFAWIPTLTSVSRQAIFSGKEPLYFSPSINTTGREEKLWRQFWNNQGLSQTEIAYKKGLGDGNADLVLDAAIHPEKTRVAGFVVDMVDKIMHGTPLGAQGVLNQVDLWMTKGFLTKLVAHLLALNFDVWLTSDHGNIQCKGIGRPREGSIASSRGERARIYPTGELRDRAYRKFPSAIEWQSSSLPANYFPLIASGNDAFVNQNEIMVSHGGISLQEVIVPLVKIEKSAP